MKRKVLAVIISIISIFALAGCGSKQDMYEGHKSGYKEITVIDGITFDVPESALSMATAVTSISEDMDFDASNVYLYKDGSSQYLLFEMDSIVIAVQKGTKFDFKNATDKENALKNEKLMNIWFDKAAKDYEYDETNKNAYKIISKVIAQVSVTDELYNDFVGELAVIQGDEEWSLFIGAPTESYKDLTKKQVEIIEHVASSITNVEGNTKGQSNTEENTVEVNNTTEITEEQELSETSENVEESTITEVEETTTETIMAETEVPSLTEDIQDEVVITEMEDEVEESTENDKAVEETESKAEPKPMEEKQEEQIKPTETNRKETINVNNQKKVERSKDIATPSSIYNMLEIGDSGIAMALNNDATNYEVITINVQSLYTEEKAIQIIKDCLKKENREYKEPPAGCTWNVIQYSLGTPLEKAYVNIKFKGLDGEKMKYRGISYTQRTFDLYSMAENKNGRCDNLYCYYAVPNGCKEYMLECGDGTIDTADDGIVSAYYKINTKNVVK